MPGHRLALGLFAAVLVGWLAVMAVLMRQSALPPEASGKMLAVFNPGTSEEQAFASLAAARARILTRTDLGFVWIVAGDEPGLAGRLEANGALGAYRELPISPTLAGCFALADAKVVNAFE
jgi:hypothetical protein